MADVVSPATRSRMMSGIRGRDTKPEMYVRRALHAAGFRYRLHDKRLPGRPDLVLPRHRAVVFVHGCFWHGHAGCKYFKVPSTRREFWLEKVESNRTRDQKSLDRLQNDGWRTAIVWECAIRAKTPDLITRLQAWILSDISSLEIP